MSDLNNAGMPGADPAPENRYGKYPKIKQPTVWQKLRHPFQYRLQFQVIPSEDAAAEPIVTSPAHTGAADRASRLDSAEQAPAGGAKSGKPVKIDRGEKKKSMVAVLAVVCAAVVCGSAISGVMIYRSTNTAEGRLRKAGEYIVAGKYDKAINVYNKLITQDEEVVAAYLGIANAYVSAEDTQSAITKLEVGYEQTSDQSLFLKMNEIISLSGNEPPTQPAAIPAVTSESSSPDSAEGEALEGEEGEEPVVQPITFGDAQFGKMVRMALGKGENEPIYQTDLDKVQSLKIIGTSHASSNATLPVLNTVDGYTVNGVQYTERGTIRSLDDVRYFRNLKRLTIGYNSLDDINGLSQSTSLDMLGLYCNSISDLSALSGLQNLEYLYLYNNSIRDISPLSELTGLRHLLLQHNEIEDLTPLRSLTQLEELFIGNNRISDITPIANMQNLNYLYAQNNQIADISVVSGMASLTDVSFVDNPVQDYSPTAGIKNINRSFATAA